MAATLIERPTERPGVELDDAGSITVAGPDGTEYRVGIPESATPTEVAAIAASVSAALATEVDDDGMIESDDIFDAWRWSGRLSATGHRAHSSTTDAWKLSGRPGLF